MRLTDYLKETGESEAAFARRAGVQQRTVNRICSGAGCNAATALAIIRATAEQKTPGGGCVALEDLVLESAGAAA